MMATAPTLEDAQKEARRLTASKIKEGYRPSGLYTYEDPQGNPLYWRVRLDHPITKKKWIRPMSFNGNVWKLEEPDFPDGKPLYRLPDIARNPTATVWVVEGEKCADALAEFGLVVTTSGAATSAGAADWRRLAGRSVIVWPDNDDPGRGYADEVGGKLSALDCRVQVVDVARLNLPEGGDCADWLAANPGATAKDIEALPMGEARVELPDCPEPESLNVELLPVMPLLREMVPEPFRPWVFDIAHRMQCPPDFIMVAAIVMAGSVIGAGCGIRPKRRDDWLVVPNLWGGIVARPGMLKSPSLAEAIRPIDRLEIRAREEFECAEKDFLAEAETAKARREALRSEMVKAAKRKKGAANLDDLKTEFAGLPEPEKPSWRRFKTNDSTIEKLSELLKENPRGVLYFRDELIGLLTSWEKPGREPDRAFYLESWNGKGTHTSDRIGRGTIFVENCCISILGGIQPGKLEGYLLQAMDNLGNDGLLQRFQVLVYPDEPKDWRLIDQYPDAESKNRVFRIIEKLAEMDFTLSGAKQDGEGKLPYFNFADDAQDLFNEWLTELQTVKLKAYESPVMQEHLSKYRKLMPALALIFHLIDVADSGESGPVSLGAAERAAGFCDYLESHARRIYGLIADATQQSTARLAEKISAGELADGFTARDVYRRGWHGLTDHEIVRLACNELVEMGWLREKITPPAFGQKSKTEYVVNPKTRGKS